MERREHLDSAPSHPSPLPSEPEWPLASAKEWTHSPAWAGYSRCAWSAACRRGAMRVNECYSSFNRQQISRGAQKIGKPRFYSGAGLFSSLPPLPPRCSFVDNGRLQTTAAKLSGLKVFLNIGDIGLSDRYSSSNSFSRTFVRPDQSCLAGFPHP